MVDRTTAGDRDLLVTVARLIAIAFLLVGILGFIPGITSDAPGDFSGDGSEAELLGIFQVSILHNIVHLLFGIVGLALARTWDGARTFLIGGGVVYIVLWVVGLIGGADWVPVNSADNWLHFVLGVVMIAAGYVLGRSPARTPVTTERPETHAKGGDSRPSPIQGMRSGLLPPMAISRCSPHGDCRCSLSPPPRSSARRPRLRPS